MRTGLAAITMGLALSLGACGDEDETNDPVVGADARPATADAGTGGDGDAGTGDAGAADGGTGGADGGT
jgi:hypothetical protein